VGRDGEESSNMRGLSFAILTAVMAWADTAISEKDEFKQAMNYVFSGNIEGMTPQLLQSIVDENNCIISVETPGNPWPYYMKEIKPNSFVIDERTARCRCGGQHNSRAYFRGTAENRKGY
jgi:hypothetical protein